MADLIYALKVSTFINHDVNDWFDKCQDKDTKEHKIDYYLALRKWYPITFAMEFRCFVKENTLVGKLLDCLKQSINSSK